VTPDDINGVARGDQPKRLTRARRRLCAVVAFWLVSWLTAAGQGFQVRSWHMANGLPDSTVTALAQTPDGYLWVGTAKGLARFDGTSFSRAETAGETALQDPSIVGLQTDHQGNLWIESESGLITQFAEGRFHTRYVPAGSPASRGTLPARLPVVQTWRTPDSVFALDNAGRVWAVTRTGSVLRFDDAGRPTVVPLKELPAGRVRGLANDEAGRVWLLKGTDVCVFEEGRWSGSGAVGIGVDGSLLCPAGERGFWTSEVSSSRARAQLVEYSSEEGWKVSWLPIPTTPAHPPVSAMLQDHHGRMWLAKVWGGLSVQLGEGEWTRVQETGPLSKGTVRCLLEDRQGSLWVGTVEQGLSQVLPLAVEMVLLPPEAADVHVTTVWAAQDGALWMGTDKGLYRGNQRGSSQARAVEGLGQESVYSVLEDARTNLWVGTRSGLFLREGSGFKRVLKLPETDGGVLALYKDRAGNTWAGGFHGLLLRRRGDAVGVAFESQGSESTVAICCFTENEQGQIWMASKRRGLGLWRLDGKQLTPASAPFSALDLIARSVVCDAEGALWVGTQGAGLFRWSNNRLQRYTTADGLPDDMIVGLATDDQGNLWMTSPSGIIGCSRRQLAEYTRGQNPPLLCLRLGLEEGLANRECTGSGQPLLARGPDGRLWAATMVGAAGFSPEVLGRMAPTAEVHVEGLSVDGVELRPEAPAFRATASARRFEFRYAAPEFVFPNALRFRYRLDGLDTHWVEAGSARLAAYGPLRPGEYQFRVMVGGADGVWREAKMPTALRVVPRFWQTGWFQVLVLATSLGAVMAGVMLQGRRQARRRLQRLEAQQAVEGVRRRISRDLHDELGSAITEIVQLGDLTLQPGSGPESLRSGLETMTGLVRQLGITVDEIVWTMSSRNDTLPNLAGYISSHAQEFFSHSSMSCRLDVDKNLPNTAVNSQTRHNLFLAVKEALNNVAKHSGAREVRVRVHQDQGVLHVSIEDNGRGFDLAAVGQGEGLKNMRERLQAVHGQAEFFTQTGGGTRVVFTLSLVAGKDAEAGAVPRGP
jgi:ligand-binding sensor domain-containing protein/signal transduction histidine kinase